jgi:hypothetical protein
MKRVASVGLAEADFLADLDGSRAVIHADD